MMQDFLGPIRGAQTPLDDENDKNSNKKTFSPRISTPNDDDNDSSAPITASDSIPVSSFTWRSRRIDDELTNRHRTDFVFLEVLGSGGFGKVYKVRNKIDSKCYALKVVPMPQCSDPHEESTISSSTDRQQFTENNDETYKSSLELRRVLREVKILSSIPSNDNVVRYYSSWVEKSRNEDDLLSRTDIGDSYDESSSTEYEQTSISYSTNAESSIDAAKDGRVANNFESPICHLCQSSYEDWEVGLEYWGLIDSVLQPLNLCVECYKKSLPNHVDTSKMNVRRITPFRRRLYILMEFCASTLETRMKEVQKSSISGDYEPLPHSEKDDVSAMNRLWSYFRQTVQGVAHLHANGIIHRDIKPNNVFVANEGIVKVGDLGLATLDANMQRSIDESSGKPNTVSHLSPKDGTEKKGRTKQSSGVGTYLYRAPEIATGRYDEKCDIYSLGVLLVELFGKFETAMERAKVLGDLKQNNADSFQRVRANSNGDDVTTPLHLQLAHRMIAPNPSDRPSCLDILNELDNRFLVPPSHQSSMARSESSVSSSLLFENHPAIELLQEKDREIARLRKLLEAHGIPYDSSGTKGNSSDNDVKPK